MGGQRRQIGERLGVWWRLVAPEDDRAHWRSRLVLGMLQSASAAATLAIAYFCYHAYVTGSIWVIPIYLAAYSMLLIVTLIRRLPYWLRAGSLLLLDYALAMVDLAESGRGGDGRVFLLLAPVMAVLLFGWRAGVLALSLDVLVMGAFGWLFASGVLDIAAAKQLSYADPYAWASNTLVLIVLGVFATFSASFALSHFCSALDRGRDLVHELEKRDRTLDTRTRELERSNALLASRANALRFVAEVARDAVSAPSVPSMLARIVTMISESLGYYHCGIFCQDPTGEWAELIAASSGGDAECWRGIIDCGYARKGLWDT